MTHSITDSTNFKQFGQAVLDIELRGLTELRERLFAANNPNFTTACELLLNCQGRIVVTGMGKSGHIGSKLAATLASTGSPAFFVHPGEASHGDMGMITKQDVVIALSNSGGTDEILTIVPLIKRLGVPLIAMTGKPNSALASAANVHLHVGVSEEACPLGLAPTASTTAALAAGDALAVALLEARGFTPEDFALSHPGGSLGRRLLVHVQDIMHTGDDIPQVAPSANLSAALLEMTRSGLGMTCVTKPNGQLLGIFTDGDLRRALDNQVDIQNTSITDLMICNFTTAAPKQLAAEALQIMESRKINALPIIENGAQGSGTLVGVLNMHDLLRAGVV